MELQRKPREIENQVSVNTGIGVINFSAKLLHCGKCKEYKSPEHFYSNRRSKTGKATYCKPCQSEYAKAPEWSAWRKQRYYADPSKTMWNEAKARAKTSGLAFDIEPSDCLIPNVCPVLGIKLSKKGDGLRSKSTPTLDRIIGALGYTKGNVRVISWYANRIKSDCDDPEVFEAIAKYLRGAKDGT